MVAAAGGVLRWACPSPEGRLASQESVLRGSFSAGPALVLRCGCLHRRSWSGRTEEIARAPPALVPSPPTPMAGTASTHPTTNLTERELRAWRGMLRVHSALTKALDAQLEAEHGLPLSHYEVLVYLAAAPERRMRMSELAESILLSRSGLTRLVDRLEREGLIMRQTCAHD